MNAQLSLNLRLPDGSSFDNFFPGRNPEALAAVRALCQGISDGRAAAALYCWGMASSGRTHLLQAACRQVQAAGRTPYYLPLREAATLSPTVVEGAEHAALVCLDDVEAIAGQTQWEQALFSLCERLRAEGGVLLTAAAQAPPHLGLELPDLVSRLAWGPIYPLQPLSDEEKVAAVRLRARNRGLEMSAEVARYILSRYPRDMHSLFALLERLDRVSLASQRRLTIPFLRSLEEKLNGQD